MDELKEKIEMVRNRSKNTTIGWLPYYIKYIDKHILKAAKNGCYHENFDFNMYLFHILGFYNASELINLLKKHYENKGFSVYTTIFADRRGMTIYF